VPIAAIEHVQLAMPPGMEDAARAFYEGLLGIPEVAKPPHLAKRGGAWFEPGSVKIHLGVEADLRPARKAHPAFLVEDLESLIERLKAHNVAVIDDEPLEGYRRVYVADPFGNRIELNGAAEGTVNEEEEALTTEAQSTQRKEKRSLLTVLCDLCASVVNSFLKT
jgi:catechol 2,3-dioxygenase-like lactoylglutathione lyase family enzyme